MFPHLFVGALLILAKREKNGFQEWVFSTGTFKNNKLAKHRNADNFKMAVLEHVNQGMVEGHDLLSQIIQKDVDSKLKPEATCTQVEEFFARCNSMQQRIFQECEIDDENGQDDGDEDEISVDVDELTPTETDDGKLHAARHDDDDYDIYRTTTRTLLD